MKLDVVRAAVRAAAKERGLPGAALGALRLFEHGAAETPGEVEAQDPWSIGTLFESLLHAVTNRKKSGSFYTPRPIAEQVAGVGLARVGDEPVVCDPALGGGAFLLAAGARLASEDTPSTRRRVAERCLTGVDVSPAAVAVTEAVLWLWVADPDFDPRVLRRRLLEADALERGWEKSLLGDRSGFDVVIGNPPWVAYAGRAAQPLEPERRARYSSSFRSFRGYPTLHGLFVERATELAPSGVIALLIPSPVADLDGYRPVRRALSATHTPREPLLELGQDAFAGVTQPCFALVADPGASAERPWRLTERQRAASAARDVEAPEALARLAALPSFPPELFGERGFQSAGDVSKTLFLRADGPDERHTIPLLEGREVREFHAGSPRLFLCPDAEKLARARCRLRPVEQYQKVRFVVRQTAKVPIAALHTGVPFRNTLLAGLEHDELRPELVVALLNSSLYRALHLALRRDARQAAFPQVKIAHLRALPRPPRDDRTWSRLSELCARATREGSGDELRAALDREVFELFGLEEHERHAVTTFLRSRWS